MMTAPISTFAINGGLGNQLFQWFFAHSKMNANSKFKIDPLYPSYQDNNAQNSHLSFQLKAIFPYCPHSLLASRIERNCYHLFNRAWDAGISQKIMTNLGYIRENPNDEVTQNFDSKIAFRYAYGYFQDEKYVNSNKKILTNEIVPTIKSNYEVLRSRLKLPETFDVIHVRKYPTEGLSFSRIHLGNLSDEYYISWFKGNKPKNLIILCEKKELVSGLLTKIDALQVLTDSDTNAWETLAIMSHARKLLTSNSTLSWWGGRISQEVSNSHVWLPSRWSYWNNVNSSNYHFQGSQTHISDFDLRGYSI